MFLLLTQSALNAGKKIMTFVLDALDSAVSEIVRGRFAWRRMLPQNVLPMADITSAGGWAALTGQQLWLVSSIFPFLVAPIFSHPNLLDDYVRAMVVAEVADRIDVNSGTPAGKAAVCAAFQDLIKACSWSSFVVRSPSFTAEGLGTLQKSQIDQVQVKQVTRVMGVALGSIHKGLHIAPNVVVNGVVTNCNVGEAKNKQQKASAPSASGRDNAEHMWRTTNDSLAMQALADGVEWTASGWTGRSGKPERSRLAISVGSPSRTYSQSCRSRPLSQTRCRRDGHGAMWSGNKTLSERRHQFRE
ncbi:hypothetical protein Esi_0230_0025 [Ectocarpus siliculosus]|uniref:Uncharacterized protein n=1 Tax=Ectocarpus siliculosus TaxID=2880 RepID=D7FSA9_ECTSI|nr:hypothetical protein Esi_0230_0025 [Ectocarpus siliculosus]|eukprot:CBJ31050.1 hypothetical protein Esi_0230_0025 [Ectocarpus siliculosus]